MTLLALRTATATGTAQRVRLVTTALGGVLLAPLALSLGILLP